ncbi:MAG: multidrug ABC transporter permease [Thermoplasmata archaeon]|nr:MAG: multidrug ABC transporter permease [Thermoplasmata archaeon]RLF36261.1 MAG: multidrug ABC transporter permease [Thermoplasmata archaeon]
MSKITELQAIYVMWLREMKRFIRARSRLLASIIQPLFFLTILGFGLNKAIIPGVEGDYMYFLAPGVIAMAIMFSSMFTGVSVLWDKKFGFLQEVLVAPVSRLSIVIGRTLGGATTALIQGLIILIIALSLGVRVSTISQLILTLIMMIIIAFTSVGFGLIIASKMEDLQGFQLIMNMLILPLFFLSSAFFPLDKLTETMPTWIGDIFMINPLFYMVDGIRGSLTGINNHFHPLIDLLVLLIICIAMMSLGSYFFGKSEV